MEFRMEGEKQFTLILIMIVFILKPSIRFFFPIQITIESSI